MRERRSTTAKRAAPPTSGFELRSKVPRIGVNAWTEMVTVVDDDAYVSSGFRLSGMI
jgi:hypothetical protein